MPSYIYPGLEMDVRIAPATPLVLVVDLPFSLCVDTIALPYDLYAVCILGRPRYDCQWGNSVMHPANRPDRESKTGAVRFVPPPFPRRLR